MAEDFVESIVREAPEIEAFKLGLLRSGKTLTDTALRLPEQQIAGFSGAEQEAFGGRGRLVAFRVPSGNLVAAQATRPSNSEQDPPTTPRALIPPQPQLSSIPLRMSLFSRL